MASRKAKPKDKKKGAASSNDVLAAASDFESTRDLRDHRPSGSLTVEVAALSNRHVPPAPPTTARALEGDLPDLADLAATVEMPTLNSLGPRILIMDAAEAVIEDRGFNQTTIREVSEWAGISVDVFHAHFADMRALLIALCERFSERAMEVVDDITRPARWDGQPPGKPVEASVRTLVEYLLTRAALFRAILASNDRPLVDEVRRVGTHLTIRLTRLLNGLGLEAPDPLDVGFAVLSAMAIAHHAAVVGPEWSGVELDRALIAAKAARSATAYIESTLRSPHSPRS